MGEREWECVWGEELRLQVLRYLELHTCVSASGSVGEVRVCRTAL
jgi:hypothetical protein